MTEVSSLDELRLSKARDLHLIHAIEELFLCVLIENEAQDGNSDDVSQVQRHYVVSKNDLLPVHTLMLIRGLAFVLEVVHETLFLGGVLVSNGVRISYPADVNQTVGLVVSNMPYSSGLVHMDEADVHVNMLDRLGSRAGGSPNVI
jgi:hypothetical protein